MLQIIKFIASHLEIFVDRNKSAHSRYYDAEDHYCAKHHYHSP